MPSLNWPDARASAATAAVRTMAIADAKFFEIADAYWIVAPVWKSNLQPDFNVRVIERVGPDSFAVLRELDESHRFVQKSAKSTAM